MSRPEAVHIVHPNPAATLCDLAPSHIAHDNGEDLHITGPTEGGAL
jgi:hypothetical protein